MHLGSDSALTPEISGGNQNRGTVRVITLTLPSLEDLILGRFSREDDDEPRVSVVGRPSLNAEGVQDEATLAEVED